jgi:threonine/homoserine/homoserine lactone efflux protein
MPEFSAFALFLAATLALNLTPGPDMLYITAALFIALGLRLAAADLGERHA